MKIHERLQETGKEVRDTVREDLPVKKPDAEAERKSNRLFGTSINLAS